MNLTGNDTGWRVIRRRAQQRRNRIRRALSYLGLSLVVAALAFSLTIPGVR